MSATETIQNVEKNLDDVNREIRNIQINNYTSNQLSEERTVLAFIRTVAIFCGLYVLLIKV